MNVTRTKQGLILGVFIVLFFALSLSRPQVGNSTEELPVQILSLDESGNPIAKTIPTSVYSQEMAQAFTSIHEAILPSLVGTTQPASPNQPQGPVLQLRTIGVGVGLRGTFGLGVIWSVSASPYLRLIFTNSTNPVYPD